MIIWKVYTEPDIGTIDVRNLDLAADKILWSRGGEQRIVPHEIAVNAAQLLIDGLKLVDAGRLPSLPSVWYSIYWEACVPVSTPATVHVTRI